MANLNVNSGSSFIEREQVQIARYNRALDNVAKKLDAEKKILDIKEKTFCLGIGDRYQEKQAALKAAGEKPLDSINDVITDDDRNKLADIHDKKRQNFGKRNANHRVALRIKDRSLTNIDDNIANLDVQVETSERALQEKNQELNALEERHAELSDSATAQEKEALQQDIEKNKEEISELERKKENAKNESQINKNVSNQMRANDAIQSCPILCEASKLSINCSHGGRKISLTTAAAPVTEFHVLSCSQKALEKQGKFNTTTTMSADIVTVSLEGSCGKGKSSYSAMSSKADESIRDASASSCPTMKVSGTNTSVNVPGLPGTPLRFKAYSPAAQGFFSESGVVPLIQYAFNYKPENNVITYDIESTSCDSSYPELYAKVVAHPKVKYDLTLSMGYNIGKKPDVDPSTSFIDPDKLATDKWTFKMSLTGQYDDQNIDGIKGQLDFENAFSSFRKVLTPLMFFLDRVHSGDPLAKHEGEIGKIFDKKAQKKKLEDAANPTAKAGASLIPPKIELKAAYENLENPHDHTIDDTYTYSLNLNPLIGGKFDIDILAILLDMALAPIGGTTTGRNAKKVYKFLSDIYLNSIAKADLAIQAANSDDDNKKISLKGHASIMLTTTGQIDGNVTWKKAIGERGIGSGKIGGTVGIILEGKIGGEANIFIVKIAAGLRLAVGDASGNGACSIGMYYEPTTDRVMRGYTEFKGLAIVFMSHLEFAVKENAAQKGTKDIKNDGKFGSNGSASGGKKAKLNWVLLNARKWPGNEDIAAADLNAIPTNVNLADINE